MRKGLLWTILLLVLAGCGGQEGRPGAEPGPASSAGYFSATLPSFDGTPIALTVFQPALAPGETAPLLLHSHGWGGHRLRFPGDTEYRDLVPEALSQLPLPAKALAELNGALAQRAWRTGYYVVSFDQRGFGESGGKARVMDPEYEGRDAQAVLDWALAHLRVAWRGGRPLVGTFGLSYGGGFQLALAARDDRVQALLPMITWYDLRYSLAPGGVPKTAWSTLLFGSGLILGRLDGEIYRAFLEGLLANRLSPATLDFLYTHSPAYPCGQGWPGRPLHALLVQGMRDTLFNLNEAYQNLRCLERGGGDVRLLTLQEGHLLPLLQAPPGGTNCGPTPFGPEEALGWFEAKLKGRAGAAAGLPRRCLSLNDREALYPDEVPLGGAGYPVPRTPVTLLDAARSLHFIPLRRLSGPMALAGLPRYRLEVHGPLERAGEATLFLGLGVRRAGEFRVQLLDDQVLPLRGYGTFQGELNGVGAALEPGDEVGLVALGFHEQYALAGRTPFLAYLEGEVELPLFPR